MTYPDEQPASPLNALLLALGILLLLPGGCTVFYAAQEIAAGDFIRLATRDPYFQFVLYLWGICLVVALGGALLVWYAVRRGRAPPAERP
jgi:hypothetical protein